MSRSRPSVAGRKAVKRRFSLHARSPAFAAAPNGVARQKGRALLGEGVIDYFLTQSRRLDDLRGRHASPTLSAARLHSKVWASASAQWQTGHRHEAVLAASKTVNSMLQAKLGRRDLAEVKLVQEAFSEKEPMPRKPRLRFPEIEDEQTRESIRMGGAQLRCRLLPGDPQPRRAPPQRRERA